MWIAFAPRQSPAEMAIEEGKPSMMQANAFPHPVSQHEAAVEHADLGIGAAEVFAIDVD
jgi:hypothetical protein